MEPQSLPPPPTMDDAQDPSSIWDFSYLLDFNLDDQDGIFTNSNSLPLPLNDDDDAAAPEISKNDRVRKRDPRMTCSNFLAGRVPCACPELDAKLEDEGLPVKKRARTARASASARCQVPGCEADISELKGYHRRHRVCLRCANAATVMLNDEAKRYCQQCGKCDFCFTLFFSFTSFDSIITSLLSYFYCSRCASIECYLAIVLLN